MLAGFHEEPPLLKVIIVSFQVIVPLCHLISVTQTAFSEGLTHDGRSESIRLIKEYGDASAIQNYA